MALSSNKKECQRIFEKKCFCFFIKLAKALSESFAPSILSGIGLIAAVGNAYRLRQVGLFSVCQQVFQTCADYIAPEATSAPSSGSVSDPISLI